MTTESARSFGSRSTRFISTSAVQQRTGASAFTAPSPVSRPMRLGPNASQSWKNFSLTSALVGAV